MKYWIRPFYARTMNGLFAVNAEMGWCYLFYGFHLWWFGAWGRIGKRKGKVDLQTVAPRTKGNDNG